MLDRARADAREGLPEPARGVAIAMVSARVALPSGEERPATKTRVAQGGGIIPNSVVVAR